MSPRVRWGRATWLALVTGLLAATAPGAGSVTGPALGSESAPELLDPLESPECKRTLSTLNAHEAELAAVPTDSAASGRRAVDTRLAESRRQAATACLVRRADPPRPPALVRPAPIAVEPLGVVPAAAATPGPRPARTGPPMTSPRPPDKPYAVTSCDPGGCWANDGSRLNRVGPNLWGPRGICTVQGGLLQCP